MKNILAVIALAGASCFTVNLAAQSRAPHTRPFAAAGPTDLNTTLINLDRVSQAMQDDIARLGVEKWRSGWKTGFIKGSSHKEQAQQAAGSLQRNLANAMPGLIHDVQSSRGGIAATFRLYDDVSLVCETLDSLITASEAAGKKNDASPLVEDYSALTRIRRSLSNYIQQSASTWETRGRMPVATFSTPTTQPSRQMSARPAAPATQPVRQVNSSSPQVVMTDQGVKKIIIDDTVPEKKPAPAPAAKKKPATTYSNLE
jgi:hypothetical protein